ncbi:hypothetical protein PD5205_01495 [Xanthomonas fragariae]|uniref:Uncharacterized protein n=1 Tax=Xanthomonas fragariae TaxID=48664 RepID=A0A1Y6H8D8_9XANT|nr:hypothetical protein PD885_01521 [Xanthomonas fragariae]SMR02804.1 hypothetical protein PD5205_01495 [Xanthomonas fragariae]
MPLRRVTVTALADQPGHHRSAVARKTTAAAVVPGQFDLEVDTQAFTELPAAMYQDTH